MKNQNNATITVRPDKATNSISFYITCNGDSHYICMRKFNGRIYGYFRNGVPLYRLNDYSRTGGDQDIIHTLQRISTMLKYIESEYELKLTPDKKPDRRMALRYRRDRYDYYEEEIA